jgi:hypothetical protein
MKCEPYGCVELNVSNAAHLGLQNVSPLQLKLISTLIMSKPVSQREIALTCLQIPIVQKYIGMKYIDSKPPHFQTKLLSKLRFLGFHPIDIYKCRPSNFLNMTFYEFLKL